MTISGAILDFDGTLVDSLAAWRDLEDALSSMAGKMLTPEEHALLVTYTVGETADWYFNEWGLGKSPEHIRKIMDDYLVDHFSHHAKLNPGAREFIEQCKRAGVELTVASSSPQIYLQAALKSTDLLPYFSAVLSVDDIGKTKREPDIYHRAREIMNTPLGSTWAFEDSVFALRVLKAAGYPTVGYFDEFEGLTREEWNELSDIVIDDFTDLSLDKFEL